MNVSDGVDALVAKILHKPSSKCSQYTMRLITSRLGSSNPDLTFVSQQIKRKIQTNTSDLTQSQQSLILGKYQSLLTKLITQYPFIKKKAAILSLLLNLSFPSEAEMAQATRSMDSLLSSSRKHQHSYIKEEAPAPFSLPDGLPSVKAATTEQTGSYNDAVDEQQLVREVIFAFQGISSKHIYINPSTNNFEVDPSLNLSTPMQTLVLKLCELGWLFLRVDQYLCNYESDPSFGVIGQSFCFALRDQLKEYYRFIAILQTQLEADSSHESRLTLRRLVLHAQDSFERIRFMACLVDSVDGLRGGALASGIYAHKRHGDPFVQRMVETIMSKVCFPLFGMIRRWVFEGALEDPHLEFFVRGTSSGGATTAVSNDQLWSRKYVLNEKMIPIFISKDLARKILVIGKSINFIRECCNDSTWVLDNAILNSTSRRSGEYSTNILADLEDLEVLITKASESTNQYVINLLLSKFKLVDHCLALKQYLLLGQGDFIQYLMDLLGPELSKRASQIYRHNLMNVLETALNSSNAKFQSSEVLNCLDVKLHQASAGDDGWDVFALHYKLSSPLNTVINDSSMTEYLQIFHFLWKLKRVEYSLAKAWGQDMANVNRIMKWIPELQSTLHKCYLLRNEVMHFTMNLHNYMMFEVLETSWQKLVEDLGNASDLDEMIASHASYLAQIKNNALLGDSSKSINVKLRGIFETIIKFSKLQGLLYTGAMQKMHLKKKRAKDIEASAALGKWGTSSSSSTIDSIDTSGEIKRLMGQINQVSMEYTCQFLSLMKMLKSRCSDSENLRFLTFRLNFNEFYQKNEEDVPADNNNNII